MTQAASVGSLLPEGLLILAATIVPTAVAYQLGKRVTPAWIGFLVAVAWLPLLLLVVPRGDRATAFGLTLWSLVPILIGFRWGRADRGWYATSELAGRGRRLHIPSMTQKELVLDTINDLMLLA